MKFGILFTIFLMHIATIKCNTPDLYTCIDWECDEWISRGKTLLRYSGKTSKHLSFKKNEDIYILSKPVDKTLSDWLGKVGDKVGLVPKDMVREDKMSKTPSKFKHLLHEIPVLSRQEEEMEDDESVGGNTNENIEIQDVDDGDDATDSNSESVKEENTSSAQIENQPVEATTTIISNFEESLQTLVSSQPTQSVPAISEMSLENVDVETKSIDMEIVSDPVMDSINLQPSTDTVLQGPTTVEYLPETPKTEEQKPTDDITPRIPETIALNSITKAVEAEIQTLIENLSVTRVEKSSIIEEETHFTVSTDSNTRASIAPDASDTTDAEQLFIEEKSSVMESENILPASAQIDDANKPTVETETSTSSIVPEPEAMRMETTTPVPTILEDATQIPQNEVTEEAEIQNNSEEVFVGADQEPPMGKIHTQSEDSQSQTDEENQFIEARKVEDKLDDAEPDSEEVSGETDEVLDSSTSTTTEQSTEDAEEPITKATIEEQDLNETEYNNSEKKSEILTENESPGHLESESADDLSLTPPNEVSVNTDGEPTLATEEVRITEETPVVADEERISPTTESSQPTVDEILPYNNTDPDHIPEPNEEKTKHISSHVEDSPVETLEHQETEPTTQTSESLEPQVNEPTPQTSESLEPQVNEPTPQTSESLQHQVNEPTPQTSESLEPQVKEPVPQASLFTSDSDANEATTTVPDESSASTQDPSIATKNDRDGDTHSETNDDHHHHHHHHRHHHNHEKYLNDTESSSIILVIKHLSSTLLSFLPEHLQDTILDVDDALVFTGIIALTLVSICVPYFLIEGYMSVRPLKKKVVELNKSLWKMSAAYETQQEEFEIFKQKAMAHDEYKKRAEQSENDVIILKKLETKHREQINALKLKRDIHTKEHAKIKELVEITLAHKKKITEERDQLKTAFKTAKEALEKSKEELNSFQVQTKSSSLQLSVSNKNMEVLNGKIAMLSQDTEELKVQVVTENEKRKTLEKEIQEVMISKGTVEKELDEIKSICHQYEETVTNLNDEISKLESELTALKDSLGEDSPLVEVAEIQAKATFAQKEAESLRTRFDALLEEKDILNSKLREITKSLEETRNDKEQTINRLQVLETYFKEREEEYVKNIEQLQLKESVRDKGKEELIRMIEEKENICKDIHERLEALKDEFEETKQQHRNEIRSSEAKAHDNWMSLCQAERKSQDARKEAELLRQRLTAMCKEKDDEDGDGLNGEVPMFSMLPHELVPLPILDEPPSYFGLGGDFVPPPPLPEGEEREPHRPPPLGGRLTPTFSDLDDNGILSPIGIGRREDDCTDGSSGSDSPRRSPIRGGWVNVQHERDGGQGRESLRRGPTTSSPIQHGANL